MQNPPDDSDRETVWISVPLDLETRKRLRGLATFCDARDEDIAASLLHDVLRDDEEVNLQAARQTGSSTIN